MLIHICEDCGSTNVTCRPDGIDSVTGDNMFLFQCRECFAEWYDVEDEEDDEYESL